MPTVFEITGGSLCLDLANTLDFRRTAEPKELLVEYADLVDWGIQAGAIDDGTARRLRGEASRDPRAASRALERARDLREAIFRVLGGLAEGKAPGARDLEGLGPALSEALAGRRLAFRENGAAWEWPRTEPPDLDRVLWPVLVSAADLLTSNETARLRKCEGATCAWLFLDRSRNGSRRWCDMTICGNRAKARRHHLKTRRKRRG